MTSTAAGASSLAGQLNSWGGGVVSWTGEPVNTGHKLLGSQMAGQQLEQLEARRNVDDVLVDLAVD